MAKTIKKRDGRTVEFDKQKIINAVGKALQKVNEAREGLAEEIASLVESECSDSLETVESIQDKVEDALIQKNLPEAAKEYILYRNRRTEIREQETALMKTLEGLFAEKGNAIKENANINGTTVSGLYYRIGSEASKDYYCKHMLPDTIRSAFEGGYIHIHDFDYYGISINCMQHDLGAMFKKGFYSGNCFITEPQSITTAMMLTCVILQSGQTDLFGGESVPAWDHYMEPYVQKSFEKYFSKYLQRFAFAPAETQKKWIKEYLYQEHTPVFENDDLYRCYSWAKKDTEAETYQAAQAMLFNMNGLCSRAGGQTVFSSLNLGTCTKPGGRLAMKALFEAMDKGIGKGITAIYPIVIFKLKAGVTYNPGDPNYDLRLTAERVTAKRQFPNYSNLDAPYNIRYYKEGHPETEVAYMGCLTKHEQVLLKVEDETKLMSIGDAFKYLDWKYGDSKEDATKAKYVSLTDTGVSVYDSSENDFVLCKGILKNPDTHNWKKIVFSDGRTLLTTADHPLPVVGKGRTQVCNLVAGDRVPVSWKVETKETTAVASEEAWLLGLLLCDGCYASSINIALGLDEEDVLVAARDVLKTYWNLETKVTKRERGEKGNYFDLYVTGQQIKYRKYLRDLFGGITKAERHLPENILSWSRASRLAFLAGMIDADGYINKTEKGKGAANRVQLGSTNPVIALQQLYLAQSLGYPAKIYENHYKKDSEAVRYRVEFGATKELVKELRSAKKGIWSENDYTSAVQIPATVAVETVTDVPEYRGYSYDFETETDRFDVSGVSSHNCRTRVIANVNGPEVVTSRGNLSFTTINLPRLGIEAMKEAIEPELREGIFFEKLDKVLEIAAEQLQERFEIQCKRKVYNFPYVMQQGAYMGSEYLSPTDNIEKALQNGTLSFGFVGLAECLRALTGHDHSEGDQYQQLGLKIVGHIKDYADKLTKERHMNWTLIATPAESVAGKFLRIDREKFGVLEGITDKEYYTNSNHVPVTTKVTASEKIRIEAPYHALTNAGHILYEEIEGDPRNNPEVIHTLVNQMHDTGAGYFSFNIKMDTCTNCGFVGLIGDTCPSCGQKETLSAPFIRPRRVTGYLSYQNRFNSAKLAELHDRVTHT